MRIEFDHWGMKYLDWIVAGIEQFDLPIIIGMEVYVDDTEEVREIRRMGKLKKGEQNVHDVLKGMIVDCISEGYASLKHETSKCVSLVIDVDEL